MIEFVTGHDSGSQRTCIIGHIVTKQTDIPDLILVTSETLGIASHR